MQMESVERSSKVCDAFAPRVDAKPRLCACICSVGFFANKGKNWHDIKRRPFDFVFVTVGKLFDFEILLIRIRKYRSCQKNHLRARFK